MMSLWISALVAVLPGTSGGLDLRLADTVQLGSQSYLRVEGRANEFTFNDQFEPVVASGPNGGFSIAWQSRRQLEGKPGVVVRSFDKLGRPTGPEALLSTDNRFAQTEPSLAVSGDRVVPFYTASWKDGSGQGVYARENRATASTRGDQGNSVTATLSDGRIVAAWVGEIGPNTRRVFARIFDAAGKPVGPEILLSGEAHGNAQGVSIASRGSEAAVAWQGLDRGIFGVRLSASGRPFGQAKRIAGPDAIEPVIASTQSGFALGWVQPTTRESYAVRARRLDAQLNPVGNLITVAGQSASQNGVALAESRSGNLLVAWNALRGNDADIYLQEFAPSGRAAGRAVRVNRLQNGSQSLTQATGRTRMVVDRDGAVTIAWAGDGGLGDPKSAMFTRLIPATLLGQSDRVALAEVTAQTQAWLAHKAEVVANTNAKMELVGMATDSTVAGPHQPPIFNPLQREDPWGRDADVSSTGGFTGILNTGWTPPDPHMAVGPNHIVAMTNGAIAFFTKDGTRTFQDEIEDNFGFWGSVGATGFVFDPEAVYDTTSGRFIAMAAEAFAPGSRSYVLIAISDDSDPNGTWYKYRFETTGLSGDLFDSPNIGVDEDVLYVTGDGFGRGANYPVYTFDKAPLLVGNPPTITRSTTLSTTTQSAGLPPVTTGAPYVYLAEHQEGSGRTQVRILALRDPLGSPNFVSTQVTVPAYSNPGPLRQRGTSTTLNTFDARFWSAKYVNGDLWFTHHVNNPVRVRWYQVRLNGWPDSGQQPSLVQSGEIGGAFDASFSSISADSTGNAVVTMARHSSSEFISMFMARRKASDAAGTMPVQEIVKTNAEPYTTAGRWGDYSGTEFDPAQPGLFWGHHEWAEGNNWRTWIQPFGESEQAVAPTNVRVIRGTFESGDLAGILTSDDVRYNVRQVAAPSISTPNVGVAVDAVSPLGTLNGLRVEIESLCSGAPSSSVVYRVELFNNNSGTWERVFEGNPTTTDSSIAITATGDPSRFIQAGNLISARLLWFDRGTASVGWRSGIDRVAFFVR